MRIDLYMFAAPVAFGRDDKKDYNYKGYPSLAFKLHRANK